MRSDPIIVTGCGHSGTRGLIEVLQACPDVYLGDDREIKNEWEFYRVVAAELNGLMLGIPGRHNHNIIPPEVFLFHWLSTDRTKELASWLIEKICSNEDVCMPPKEAKTWVFKTPRTLLCLEVWRAVFPDAIFVNLVRDGRDVAVSLPEDAGSVERRFDLWRSRVNRSWIYREKGFPIVDVKYEDLPNEIKVREFCQSVGLEFRREMLENLRMSVGKGVSRMRRMKYERFELLRYGYPV